VLAVSIWQSFLDALGWVMAQVFSVVPNYAATIVIVTVVIRLLLLPFGFMQIRSMQHMQAIQPKVKEIQKKFKNNKQKQQEETMRLYKEAGVNPLGGCLPLLLTLPFLIAMYAVIRPPTLAPSSAAPGSYVVQNNHLPENSELFHDVLEHQGLYLGPINLQCSVSGSGTQVVQKSTDGQPLPDDAPVLSADSIGATQVGTTQATLDCGTSKFPDVIPYVLLLALMVGAAFYQQRQMQKASPPNAQTGQQQAIMRFMPLISAFWGWLFPAGLVLYWSVSNALQIGQQAVMLKAGHIGPDALERRMAEQRERLASGAPRRRGVMGWMSEKMESASQQADVARQQRTRQQKQQAGRNPQKRGAQASKQTPSKGAKPGNQLRPKKKKR
jgi:YidC/Oxa1 family membrane protein insertase